MFDWLGDYGGMCAALGGFVKLSLLLLRLSLKGAKPGSLRDGMLIRRPYKEYCMPLTVDASILLGTKKTTIIRRVPRFRIRCAD